MKDTLTTIAALVAACLITAFGFAVCTFGARFGWMLAGCVFGGAA